MPSHPRCDRLDACATHEGPPVVLSGIYTLHDPYPPGLRDAQPDRPMIVKVVLADGNAVFLEPFWHEDARRPDEEMSRLEGLAVTATGTFYQEQPRRPGNPPYAAHFSGACLFPVEGVEAIIP